MRSGAAPSYTTDMRRLLVTLLVVLLPPATFRPPAVGVPARPHADFPTGVAHQLTADDGEWRLVDGLFDATGPDLDGIDPRGLPQDGVHQDVDIVATSGAFGSHRLVPGGDFTLPTDRTAWPDFTAELAGVRFTLHGQRLAVEVRYTSMPRHDAQVATITFAAAGAPGPSRPWPADAGVRSPWQAALTVSGTTARLDHVGPPLELPAAVGDHAHRVEVPLASLPARPWSVVVGSGLSDPARPGAYWRVPTGPATPTSPGARGVSGPVAVWDVAQAGRSWGAFGDRRQAEMLASGDVTGAAFVVGPGDGARSSAEAGTVTRTFTSRWDGGDGIVRDPSGVAELGPPPVEAPTPDPGPGTSWIYTGALQHYGLHVPPGLRDASPAPLVVYLHGSGGDVSELFTAFPSLVAELSERGFLVAAPLGRGDTFYRSGPGELDVLEAIADVRRHYEVDPDRIFLIGFSGGAAGVNVVSSRHPDLFAGTIALGATWEEPGLVDNVATLPWLGVMAETDPTSQALDAPGLYAALSALADDATLVRYPAKTHEFSLVYDSESLILDFVTSHQRDRTPPVVRWTVKPHDARPALGLTRDGAWWVDRVEAADGSLPATIAAHTGGVGRGPADPAVAVRREEIVDIGGRSGRSLAQVFTTRPAANPQPVSNGLDVVVRNVGRTRVDLAGAVLSARRSLALTTDADRPVLVELAGVSGDRLVSVDGGPGARVASAGGVLPLQVPAGAHHLTIEPADG